MCSRPFETRSRPRSLAAIRRGFTLITRTARARASYPSCVAVYPRDFPIATCSMPATTLRDGAADTAATTTMTNHSCIISGL
jgi:hypothetical protein